MTNYDLISSDLHRKRSDVLRQLEKLRNHLASTSLSRVWQLKSSSSCDLASLGPKYRRESAAPATRGAGSGPGGPPGSPERTFQAPNGLEIIRNPSKPIEIDRNRPKISQNLSSAPPAPPTPRAQPFNTHLRAPGGAVFSLRGPSVGPTHGAQDLRTAWGRGPRGERPVGASELFGLQPQLLQAARWLVVLVLLSEMELQELQGSHMARPKCITWLKGPETGPETLSFQWFSSKKGRFRSLERQFRGLGFGRAASPGLQAPAAHQGMRLGRSSRPIPYSHYSILFPIIPFITLL